MIFCTAVSDKPVLLLIIHSHLLPRCTHSALALHHGGDAGTCCEEWVNKGVSRSVRSAERLKTLKLFHDRADTVIGVGVGPKVDKAYIDTLSKNVPSGNYFHADDYSSMDNLLENLAKVACPTSVPSLAPTAAPSTTPSNAPTAIPSGHPTHSGTCTVAERNLCDAAHGICSCAGSDPVTGCDIKVCTCSQGTACKVGSTDCAICTVTPTSAPSTLSPTQVPSTTPTLAPSLSTAPTAAPSIDPFFLVDDPLDDSCVLLLGVEGRGRVSFSRLASHSFSCSLLSLLLFVLFSLSLSLSLPLQRRPRSDLASSSNDTEDECDDRDRCSGDHRDHCRIHHWRNHCHRCDGWCWDVCDQAFDV